MSERTNDRLTASALTNQCPKDQWVRIIFIFSYFGSVRIRFLTIISGSDQGISSPSNSGAETALVQHNLDFFHRTTQASAQIPCFST